MTTKLQTLIEMKKLIDKEILLESRKSKTPSSRFLKESRNRKRISESLGRYLTNEEAKYLALVVTDPKFSRDRDAIVDDDSFKDNGKFVTVLDEVFDSKSDYGWNMEISNDMRLVFYYWKYGMPSFDDDEDDDYEPTFIYLPEFKSKNAWDTIIVKLLLEANSQEDAVRKVTGYFEALIAEADADGDDYVEHEIVIDYGDNSLLEKALSLPGDITPVVTSDY